MIKRLAVLSGTIIFAASLAFSADYSSMSTEELAAMRGTMQNATTQERTAFQQEWLKRLNAMTPEEQQKYLGRPQGAGQGGMGGPGQGMGPGGSGSRGAGKPMPKGPGGRGFR
ncbi:MAG: hypothetical protein RBT37_05695 [Dissulfurispiraceae bacterium]|jgi:hypothetical protein|nr:hypothetical protein [Dissulfurispiraceae bacterium]